MEAEHGAACHADVVMRHDAQDQRAGRQAGSVDHHALAGSADLVEQVDEWPDLSAGACEDADLGPRQQRRERPQGDGKQGGEDDPRDGQDGVTRFAVGRAASAGRCPPHRSRHRLPKFVR